MTGCNSLVNGFFDDARVVEADSAQVQRDEGRGCRRGGGGSVIDPLLLFRPRGKLENDGHLMASRRREQIEKAILNLIG